MINSSFDPKEEDFIEAKNYWELDKLYIDLASSKGKALTPVEKKFLRGLLCGFSPAEIASIVYKSRSSSTVRVYLSNGLYKYLEEMLSNQTQTNIKIKIWSRVTHLLEKAGYKKSLVISDEDHHIKSVITEAHNPIFTPNLVSQQDWGEANDVSIFYGRESEINYLQQAIIKENSQMVFIFGMAGIGKTALSVKLAQQVQDKFEFVFWRSLNFKPSLDIILNQLIELISPLNEIFIANTVDEKINYLLEYLRIFKCLIVLDSFEPILNSQSSDNFADDLDHIATIKQINYCTAYENYGHLIKRLGESEHQSCIIIISREKPPEINSLGGGIQKVKILNLAGLSVDESREILTNHGLNGLQLEKYQILNKIYNGNPLFLKIVATVIRDIFLGNIDNFIEQRSLIFGEIKTILDYTFNRLNTIEKQILYCSVFSSDTLSFAKLREEIIPRVSRRLILEAIELLQRRCLIEINGINFTVADILVEYLTERLIEDNLNYLQQQKNYLLINHSLFENYLNQHLRDNRR